MPGLLALVAVAMLLATAPGSEAWAGPTGSGASRDYLYSCPPGLLATGTADGGANGQYCAFWLLPSFPLGGSLSPDAVPRSVPGLDVLPVWRHTQGAGVTVAVIDTGVDPSSADIAPNLLNGWNFYDGNADTSDGGAHGTLLASIIGAAAGNGDYVGIAPHAKILPVKIMGGPTGEGWSDKAAVQGVEYAIAHGAKVLNCSFGSNREIPGMAKALADARKAGALVVIAAGNNGANLESPGSTESPDGYGLPNTLTVGNFNVRGELAADSNYGSRHVQIASLGDDLWGDYPGTTNGGHVGGTSAATATVSAVAALLFSAYPAATAGQVRRAIMVGANRTVPSLQGKVETNGLLSAPGAFAAMASPDTTRPGAFRAYGPAFTFRLLRRTAITFRWSRAADAELEGYHLTLDGRPQTFPADATAFTAILGPGRHSWSLDAYDVSGNETSPPGVAGR